MNYYNEFDEKAARWIEELIYAGHIPYGYVDTRSISDVTPGDLEGFTQCHFFAGIGGWSLALKLAGWPDERPVWTGSCPCQPFSAAGTGAGFADERHLWPHFHHLISQRRPPTVFGEQVASAAGLGWLDLVRADLEGESYAFGAADLCAAGVGAPHIRQRLYWVADANDTRLEGRGAVRQRADQRAAGAHGVAGGLADADNREQYALLRAGQDDPTQDVWSGETVRSERRVAGRDEGKPDGLREPVVSTSPAHGHWRDADWLQCRDEKWRPVEPGTFPLAHGLSARVGRLRGYGNAIVPHVAAAFVRAYVG